MTEVQLVSITLSLIGVVFGILSIIISKDRV